MPISGPAGAWSCNDFHQTECGGTKLLLEFTLKIGLFSVPEHRNFQFDLQISPSLG
jgi:hypothetical protein